MQGWYCTFLMLRETCPHPAPNSGFRVLLTVGVSRLQGCARPSGSVGRSCAPPAFGGAGLHNIDSTSRGKPPALVPL